MTTVGSLLGAGLLVISLAASAAADFAIYPGAQREQQLEQKLAQLAKNDPNSQGVEWESMPTEFYLTPERLICREWST